MMGLTEKQARVYRYIQDFLETHNMPPTRAEIAEGLGFRSVNAAVDHLRTLERKGFIKIWPGSSRGIQLVEEEEKGLPLVGRVAAGEPILAAENLEDTVDVNASLFSPRADYLLRVRGESMRDAGILDGDLLAVHRTVDVQTGQVVVARIEDEVTVKRFRRQGDRVLLLPENPDYEPIEVDLRAQQLTIEGLGVGVIRSGHSL